MISKKEKYINLSTKKKNGTFINTPVWFAQDAETNNYYVYTLKKSGKVKRIKNFPDVRVAPCNFRGKIKSNWIYATADLIYDSSNIKFAYTLLIMKYGIIFKIGNFLSWIIGNYKKRQIIKFSIKNPT